MQEFLSALNPSVRAEVESALSELPQGRQRLETVVGDYLLEGSWPTDPETVDFLARRFIHETEPVRAVAPRVRSTFGASGIGATTVAGLAGGAISIGAGKGAVVLASGLINAHWLDLTSYALGIQPEIARKAVGAANKVAKTMDWPRIGPELVQGAFGQAWDSLFGQRLEKMFISELTGSIARSAWRGSRSALFNSEARAVGDISQTNDWVEAYVSRLAANQKALSERTARYVLNRGQVNGLTPHQIGRRIGELWSLTPQHAAAVENYREGLARQELRAGRIRTLVSNYADRLMRSRYQTLSYTEALSAFNLGRETEWMRAVQRGDMPIDTVKMWVTAQDELVCKVCRPLDGKTAALGQAFETENSRIVVPAIHPNCRCIIVPVAEGTADVGGKEFIFPGTKVSKHLGGPDGTADHPSGTPQSIHSGKTEEPENEPVWNFVTRILSGGDVESRHDLTKEMRTRNRQASTPLRKMRNGKITDFSTRQLGLMTEGVGFRLGNENHIKQFANKILDGEDVFRYGRRRDPVMVLVYNNGAQVLDGKHRLAAAHLAGQKKVPVQVARIKKDMPEPEGLRQEWDELRRNLVRYQNLHNELPPRRPKEKFETRPTRGYERRFNTWMQTRSALRDEERFLEYGVERGTKPKRFGKAADLDARWEEFEKKKVWVKEHTRDDGTKVKGHYRDTKGGGWWSGMNDDEKAAAVILGTYAGVGAALLLGTAIAPGVRSARGLADLSRLRLSSFKPGTYRPSNVKFPSWDGMWKFTSRYEDMVSSTAGGLSAPRTRAMMDQAMELADMGYFPKPTDARSALETTKRVREIWRNYHGATITNPSIHGMQHAANKIFNLKAETRHFARRGPAQVALDNNFMGRGYDGYVRAQHAVTQRHLAELGIDTVPLARGMTVTMEQARAMGLRPVLSNRGLRSKVWQRAEVPLQPLNSFTSNPEVAMKFAAGVTPSRGNVTLVMRNHVPKEQIFSSHATGPGQLAWDEWVVMGGNQTWDVVAVRTSLLKNTRFARRLWEN